MIARLTSPSIEHPEIIGLEIMNAGSTSAIDISVAFSPDLPKVRVSDLKHPFGDYKMVNLPSQALRHVEDQVIAEWPPGLSTTYTYWVGVDPDIYVYAIDGLSPKTKVTFSYSDEARKADYVGTFLLDPSIYSAAKHRIAETFNGADSATPKVEEI
ncbi:hypothetical protein [Dietzia sp. Alg238-R159]|uniref:hypothetical protein n=1 Tax=Dietzia sp. Alg238-R159 TaxID=2305986 RepID=UPI0013D713BD|nr:hypothetical protein [Dietzia sp. Alg238-R159]